MNAFFFLLLVTTTNIVVALPNFSSMMAGKSKGGLSLDGKISVMNTADGGFPSSPSYLVIGYYEDVECNALKMASSFLLDTCMSSDTGSIKYTCGESFRYNTFDLTLFSS